MQNLQLDFENNDIKSKSSFIYSNKKDDQQVTIDDFQLIKVIGRGAFGKVMKNFKIYKIINIILNNR